LFRADHLLRGETAHITAKLEILALLQELVVISLYLCRDVGDIVVSNQLNCQVSVRSSLKPYGNEVKKKKAYFFHCNLMLSACK
jgi:hypothetical protein